VQVAFLLHHEEITVAAKPAVRAVKVQPLSGLRRMVQQALDKGDGNKTIVTGGHGVPSVRN